MKQKDIALVLVMVFIGGLLSFFVSRAIFGSPEAKEQTAEVVDLITPEFPEAPEKYYNAQSINPSLHTGQPAEDDSTESDEDEDIDETEDTDTDDSQNGNGQGTN